MNKHFIKRKFFDRRFVPLERRKTRLMLFIILWGIILTWLIKNFVVSIEIVRGPSMFPSFQKGGYYFVNKFIYNFTEPKRQDVVVIKKHIWLDRDELIKRVIGLPGETVEIKNGSVYINQKPLFESYVRGKTSPPLGPIELKENMYFVLGDNRELSYDSRHFGPIKKNEIRGRVVSNNFFTQR